MNFNELIEKIKKQIELKKSNKVIEKEREHFHKEVLKEEKAHRNDEKVAPEDSYISLHHINKIYPNHVQAVFDFNLDIKKHEFIVLVGPSGCGKSTTLRMVAGLEDITSGDLFIDGIYANQLPPKDRDIGMVFQSYALYPHMTVYENMAFGLKINHVAKDEIERRVLRAADILQIRDYLNRKPSALSGGQCQRVALGRAIVRDAKVFLMDEPLSNLDAKLRVQMRSEIVKLHKALDTTTIYVTHDQTEAMTMASRIVVMNKGYIQQIGTPSEIYNNPANVFVATFVGSPAMNIFNAKYEDGYLVFGDNLKYKLDDTFKDSCKKFYIEEVEKVKDEIQKHKDLWVPRFKSTRQFKKIEEVNKSVGEVKAELNGNSLGFDISSLSDVEIVRANNAYYASKVYDAISSLYKENLANKFDEINIKNKLEALIVNEDKYSEIMSLFDSLLGDYLYEFNITQNPEIKQIQEKLELLQGFSLKNGEEFILGIRPEDIYESDESDAYSLKISVAELMGHEYYVHFDLVGEEMVAKTSVKKALNSDDILKLKFDREKVHIFDKITKEKII